MKTIIVLDGSSLSIEDVVLAARGRRHSGSRPEYPQIRLSKEARKAVKESWNGVQDCIEAGQVMYGINTGCGSQKGVTIPEADIISYQAHYIPAHCTGVGDPYPIETTRAAMLLRVNSFAKANSGVSLALCEKILELLNKNVIPVVPEQGSVGSSGDLCPLAHLGALITGIPEQLAWCHDSDSNIARTVHGREVMDRADVNYLILGPKEAMGLTNGATFSLATVVLAYFDAKALLKQSNVIMALSLEAIRGELAAFDPRIHEARNHIGQIKVAADIRNILEGSERVATDCRNIELSDEVKKKTADGSLVPRVQDAYSFRCYPQVAGSVYQTLEYVRVILEAEVNASTDNPLVFSTENNRVHVLSGGNFHGEPIAHACDYLKIAIQSLANISNSRFFALLDSRSSYGLPDDLSGPTNRDLNTGLMILQYSVASLVSENKVICHPASVDSIPTSAGQEDYVAMAPISARHLRQVVDNTLAVLAAEFIGAGQGISLTQSALGNPRLGLGTSEFFHYLREVVSEMDDDRYLHKDWQNVIKLLKADTFVA